jgi:hypothetical protein
VTVTYGGENSITGFFGYHDDFVGPGGAIIPYAVVTYPGGIGGTYPKLSVFETLTKTTAHELAEAVTDPQGGQVGPLAWVDLKFRDPTTGQRGSEIADITNDKIIDWNGYVIQAVANKKDQPVLPAGAHYDPRFLPQTRAGHRARRHRKHHAPRHAKASKRAERETGDISPVVTEP